MTLARPSNEHGPPSPRLLPSGRGWSCLLGQVGARTRHHTGSEPASSSPQSVWVKGGLTQGPARSGGLVWLHVYDTEVVLSANQWVEIQGEMTPKRGDISMDVRGQEQGTAVATAEAAGKCLLFGTSTKQPRAQRKRRESERRPRAKE